MSELAGYDEWKLRAPDDEPGAQGERCINGCLAEANRWSGRCDECEEAAERIAAANEEDERERAQWERWSAQDADRECDEAKDRRMP